MASGGSDVPKMNDGDLPPAQLAAKLRKTKVYDRAEIEEPVSRLEGLTFSTEDVAAAPKKQKAKKPAEPKPTLPQSEGSTNPEDEGELNLEDLPERLSDTAGLGNMPELTLLLEDDDVIARFEDPDTAKLLREISMDPSKLEELKTKPQIQWMLDKIEEKKWIINHEPKYAQYRKAPGP